MIDSPHISYENQYGSFNYRAAAIAIVQEKVLLLRIEPYSFFILPGGRVEFYETSKECLQREIEEETGYATQVTRPLWAVEDIYPFEGQDIHELCIYYEIVLPEDFPKDGSYKREEAAKAFEGEKLYEFSWVPLKELKEIDLRPAYLKDRLLALPKHLDFFTVKYGYIDD
jgi:8-oxo-dGTP pyrophosphatase MutT (NUDIX family)